MKQKNNMYNKGQFYSQRVLLAIVPCLLLGGCATPQAVERVSQIAQVALAQSDHALRKTTQLSHDFQTHAKLTHRRFAALAKKQARLKQHLTFIDDRIAAGSGKKAQEATVPVGFMARLIVRARKSAEHPYKPPGKVPSELAALNFTKYSKIRFDGKVPSWPLLTQFRPQFYPAGYLFHHAVNIYLLKHGRAEQLQFPKTDFSFDTAISKALPQQIPLAGFSMYYPFSVSGGMNEFLSFQGASYFRALGAGQTWGLSARGVAINTAMSHLAEEFPYYKAFWIVPPAPDAKSLTFFAQLDSPSMTGAYRFTIHPGVETVMDVKMVLFARKSVKRLGIAPLTSMFLQGATTRFAPLLRAVHDSGGLSVESGNGHWLWLPLRNPKHLVVQKLPFTSVRGFGLMQRARHYSDYLAYGMNYQKRPSAWITPTGGDWGRGHIVLVELPTNSETNDNITAFWMPAAKAKPGQPMTFNYHIAWQGDKQTLPPLGYVSATRYRHAAKQDTYVINFRGGNLDMLPAWIVLKPIIHIDGPASLTNAWLAKNHITGRWRLEMHVKRSGAGLVSIKTKLAYQSRILTETWKAELPRE